MTMMLKRKVAVITGKGEVKMITENLLELKEHEVRIRVNASLISPGTEIASVAGLRATPDLKASARVFGYANAGEIIKVKGDVKGLKAGMRVAAMGGTGAHHANYANVPVNMVVPIPDCVTYKQAAYACLGATSLQAIRRTVPELGEYGMVLGLGIVGNLAAQLAQISGARVIGWEGFDSRLKIAKKCGIRNFVNFKTQDSVEETKKFAAPYGADFAIFAFGGEATAAFESVKSCMKVSADTHAMGRIILVGGCKINVGGGAHSGNLDIRAASRTGAGYKDLKYEYGSDYPAAFVQFTTQRNLREIIQLIAEKRLIVDPMTTHFMPLEEVGKAADLLIDHPDKAMGIVLEMPH
jgi:threonine dehydrogenase-like Zn-dependent dehydrogenase